MLEGWARVPLTEFAPAHRSPADPDHVAEDHRQTMWPTNVLEGTTLLAAESPL